MGAADVKAGCESVLAAVPKEFLAWEVGSEDVRANCKFVLAAVPKVAWQTNFEFVSAAVLGECLALEVARKEMKADCEFDFAVPKDGMKAASSLRASQTLVFGNRVL